MVKGTFGCDFGLGRELGWYGGAARGVDGVWRWRMVAGVEGWLGQGVWVWLEWMKAAARGMDGVWTISDLWRGR